MKHQLGEEGTDFDCNWKKNHFWRAIIVMSSYLRSVLSFHLGSVPSSHLRFILGSRVGSVFGFPFAFCF